MLPKNRKTEQLWDYAEGGDYEQPGLVESSNDDWDLNKDGSEFTVGQ